jgi:hypothetical protein
MLKEQAISICHGDGKLLAKEKRGKPQLLGDAV